MLYIQYINSDVKAQASNKLGRIRKSPNAKHIVLSNKAVEFMSIYRAIVNTPTKDEYNTIYEVLCIRAYGKGEYEVKYDKDDLLLQIRLFKYLRKQQFNKHYKLYIKAQTNDILSYRYDTTSLVKSGYASLKGQLGSSKSDILTFFRKLLPFFKSYIIRYYIKLSKAQNLALTTFLNIRYYNRLVRIISSKGIRLYYE